MINLVKKVGEGYTFAQTVLNFLKPYEHLNIEEFGSVNVFLGIHEEKLGKPFFITSCDKGFIFRFIYLKTKDGWITLNRSVFESYKYHPFFFDGLEAIVFVEKDYFDVKPVCSVYFVNRSEIEQMVNTIEVESLVNEILNV